MNPPIVADAGPLIALARVGLLPLLKDLYGRVIVPPRVWAELRLDEDRPGALAEQRDYRFLLLDERRGREVAQRRGLRGTGTAGILIAAKGRGLLESVTAAMDLLAASGYHFSQALRNRVLQMAGELSLSDTR